MGMVGKRAMKLGAYIEFIPARLPTLQIGLKKRKYQNKHTPRQSFVVVQ